MNTSEDHKKYSRDTKIRQYGILLCIGKSNSPLPNQLCLSWFLQYHSILAKILVLSLPICTVYIRLCALCNNE